MKKIYYLLLGLMLVLSTALVSCSDDDDSGTSSSSLVGRWKYNNTAFVFNSDKTGYHETDLKSEGFGIRKSSFTWKNRVCTYFLTGMETGDIQKGNLPIYICWKMVS